MDPGSPYGETSGEGVAAPITNRPTIRQKLEPRTQLLTGNSPFVRVRVSGFDPGVSRNRVPCEAANLLIAQPRAGAPLLRLRALCGAP